MIKLFVGLGNPGAEYEDTRHNAGFWWIDQLAQQLKVQLQPEKNFHGWVARTSFQGETIWLLKPATFMNLSGKSVPPWRGSTKSIQTRCWLRMTSWTWCLVKPSSSWAAATPATTVCVTSMPNWAPTPIGGCA